MTKAKGMTTESFPGPGFVADPAAEDATEDTAEEAPAKGAAPVVCSNCGESPWEDESTSYPPADQHVTPCIWCGADPR